MKQTIDMKEEIKKLVEVQKLDEEKYDLQSLLETFPEKIKEMDELLEAKKDAAQNTGEELKVLQVLKNEKETEMQIKEEKINKHKMDLYQIKNNKEYTALEQEIKSIRADVSILEEEIIGYFDKIEEARILRERKKVAFESEGKKFEQKKVEIAAEEKKLLESLSRIDSTRGALAKNIAPKVLEVYERIIKNKGRIALAKVNGDFCGGCNMQLRPQIVNDAKLQKNIVYCENCGRMIYAES